MATVKFYTAADMTSGELLPGVATYADAGFLEVEYDFGITDYFGQFSYPNGEWTGTITAVFDFNSSRQLNSSVVGLSLDTSYAIVGSGAGDPYEAGLAGNDNIDGSGLDDRLRGFAGRDTIVGRAGNDVINGDQDHDRLTGGGGNDRMGGGTGNDALSGSTGNDILRGGKGADKFIFEGNDGSDRIRDFEDGIDHIVLRPSVDISDISFEDDGFGTVLFIGDTVVTMEDFSSVRLDIGDFVFT